MTPETQGDVTFVSGGVGQEERAAMRAMRANYSLSLLFSIQQTDGFVSGVKVHIADSRGKPLLDAVSEGPMFLAKLKAGRYDVCVDRDGREICRNATVSQGRLNSLTFVWPRQQGD